MTAGILALPPQFAALFGPLTDPATDTENAAIIRHASDTLTQALSRSAATIAQDAPNPWAVGPQLSGTISYSGGATINGVGTHFLTELTPGANIVIDVPAGQDPAGEGYRYALLMSGPPTSDTSAPIGGYAPYFAASVGSVTGATYRTEIASIGGGGFNSVIEVLLYYDFAWAIYQAGYKYANATLLANADTVARLWWDHPIVATARRAATVGSPGIVWPGSRHGCIGGLIAWALRGCPGATKATPAATVTNVWTYAYNFALAMQAQWLGLDKTGLSYIPYDVRDGGYALHWLTMLSRVHPDSTVRADCQSKAITAAIDYYCRLQFPDGTWRAGTNWPNATLHTQTIGPANLAMQPFLTGLLVNALIDLHRAIRADVTQTAHAATILASIKLGIDGFRKTYGGAPIHPGLTAVTAGGSAAVRGYTYAFGSADLGYDTTTYCEVVPDLGTGERWYDPKRGIQDNYTASGDLPNSVAQTRFLNSTTVHAPYYAAIYETDPTKRAAFLSFGDELLDSQWGLGDGYHSQYDTPFPKNKDWDEHMRAQMRGLAWRKLAVAGATSEPELVPPAPASHPGGDPMVSLRTALARLLHLFAEGTVIDTTKATAALSTLVTNVTDLAEAAKKKAAEGSPADQAAIDEFTAAIGQANDAIVHVKDSLGVSAPAAPAPTPAPAAPAS